MKVKVYNGTSPGQFLCENCRFHQAIEGQKEKHRLDLCQANGTPFTVIPFPVSKCPYFKDAGAEQQMYGGLVLSFDKGTGRLMIGGGLFTRPLTVEEYLKQGAAEEAPADAAAAMVN